VELKFVGMCAADGEYLSGVSIIGMMGNGVQYGTGGGDVAADVGISGGVHVKVVTGDVIEDVMVYGEVVVSDVEADGVVSGDEEAGAEVKDDVTEAGTVVSEGENQYDVVTEEVEAHGDSDGGASTEGGDLEAGGKGVGQTAVTIGLECGLSVGDGTGGEVDGREHTPAGKGGDSTEGAGPGTQAGQGGRSGGGVGYGNGGRKRKRKASPVEKRYNLRSRPTAVNRTVYQQ